MRCSRIGTNQTAACRPKPRKSNKGPTPDREHQDEGNLPAAGTRRSGMQHKLAEKGKRRREGGGEEGRRGKEADKQTSRHADMHTCRVV